MKPQDEFNFGGGNNAKASADDGHKRWLAQRQQAANELARQINLPLGHPVEVWLVGSVRLRGKLQLQEEKLFWDQADLKNLGLRVDHVPFSLNEMESCVRLD